jgi:hypothetical protein
MSELSISNVIRVTVQGVQRSRTPKNVNDVALFTPEQPNNLLESMYVIDPYDVAEAYGTNSLTYKMALNVFAQDVNLLSGRGGLVIIPMKNATNATAASFASAEIDETALAAFKLVNNGALTITEGETEIALSGLNFTKCKSVEDIAKVLQAATSLVKISVDSNTIVFTSEKLGASGSIVLSAGASGTDISGSNYLNISGGTTTAGTDATGETLSEAIVRTYGRIAYAGVMCAKYMADDEVIAANSVVMANDLIFVNVWYSKEDILGVCNDVRLAGQNRCRCLVYTNGFEDAKLMMAAAVGRGFCENFEGSNVSQTLNLKTLANVLPDEGISQTDLVNAKTAGVDVYVSYDGDPSYVSNGANDYFDAVYEKLALKFYAQVGLYNALKTTGTKLPQTEAGVSVLKNALGNVFRQFVRNGVLAPGKWNNAQTFGDPETFRDNIANQGWYVYSMPIAQQSQAEREARVAPYIQGACKMSGAIHSADVLIVVEE